MPQLVKGGKWVSGWCAAALALGFFQHGPIYELALNHNEIEVFTVA